MSKPNSPKKDNDTSWEPVKGWYQNLVGKEGHYYHQKVIFPGLDKLISWKTIKEGALLDLACGTGILASQLPPSIPYVGVDIAPGLIQKAKKEDKNPLHHYLMADVSKPLQLDRMDFSHAAIILALQNIEMPLTVFKNAYRFLRKGGSFFIVLNHPCFRIPRQSSWGVDKPNKIQYRRIDRYLSAMKVPIAANPSKGEKSVETYSFHYPLSSYAKWLHEAGFAIQVIEEWASDKVSEGGAAAMENRSRAEIPLFMLIQAIK